MLVILLLAQGLDGVWQAELLAVNRPVSLLDATNRVPLEAPALQPTGVDATWHRRIAIHQHKRGHITIQPGGIAREAVRAHSAELVDQREAAQDHPVANVHMTGEAGVIRKDGMAADLAVMGHMAVRHDPVVAADAGGAVFLERAPVDGHVLTDDVAIADERPGVVGRLGRHVLRDLTHRGELEDLVVFPDAGLGPDHDMRTDARARADFHIGPDDAVRADVGGVVNLRAGLDDGRGMNTHSTTDLAAHMRSAVHTVWSSTQARASNFQISRL